jgi:hypothetical protein
MLIGTTENQRHSDYGLPAQTVAEIAVDKQSDAE